MSQTLLFPTENTDKGTILDAGQNTGGLRINGKLVCLLGIEASHPQGVDILLFHSSGITLDGVPIAIFGSKIIL